MRTVAVGVLVVAAAVAAAGAAGCVTTYRGVVYADANHNGARDDGETGIAHATVAYGHAVFAETDDTGAFDLQLMDGMRGVVWVSVPNGYQPGPVWTVAGEGSSPLALGVRPLADPVPDPMSFVLASDSHISPRQPFGGDLAAALAGMAALDPPPAFVTVTGDLTQGNADDDFDLVDDGIAGLTVPYVTVPGNHDWYDGGPTWFRREGPDNYSFDLGSVHFVIWNMMMPLDEITTYLGLELAHVPGGMTVVAMTHAPPIPPIIAVLKQLGVDYVLSGHTHTNRVVDHGGMIELTTEPLLMGGLDQLPGGYRVITIDHGALSAVHRTTVDGAQLAVIAPSPATCVAASGVRAVVAAELDAGEPAVTAAVDCGTPITLARDGGWSFTGELPALGRGWHTLTVDARAPSGLAQSRTVSFEVCDEEGAATPTAPWPQTGGAPMHAGAIADEVAPPLAPRWTATVGGHIVHAPPVIADGAVFVTATDLGDGRSGGLAAFDLATGALRWRLATTIPVRGAPAVIGQVVAVGRLDGVVLAFDTRTGAPKWTANLGEGLEPEAASFFASAAADGTAFVLGNQRRLAALDAETGALKWQVDPVPGGHYSQSLAAVAIAPASATVPGGLVVGTFHRDQGGVVAIARDTGAVRWRLGGAASIGIEATPVIADDIVYLVNSATDVTAVVLATGVIKWTRRLREEGFEWGQASVGEPAVAEGVVVVPTMLQDLVGLDAATGAVLWRHSGRPSPLRTNHYFGSGQSGFESGPVITGSMVWAADTSGHLGALDLHSGALLWETELGVPVLANLSLAGTWLVVGSYDGSVRALAPTARVATPPAPGQCGAAGEVPLDDDSPMESGGCCSAGTPAPLRSLLPLALVGTSAIVMRRRRRY